MIRKIKNLFSKQPEGGEDEQKIRITPEEETLIRYALQVVAEFCENEYRELGNIKSRNSALRYRALLEKLK